MVSAGILMYCLYLFLFWKCLFTKLYLSCCVIVLFYCFLSAIYVFPPSSNSKFKIKDLQFMMFLYLQTITNNPYKHGSQTS
jgi:hypothetical protein